MSVVFKVLQTLIAAVLVTTLAMGQCLPCRDLYGKSSLARTCCNKSGACNKVPTSKNEKRTPCPLQQNLPILQKAGTDAPTAHFVFAVVPTLPAIMSALQPSTIPLRLAKVEHDYSPPPLYVLHERFLI